MRIAIVSGSFQLGRSYQENVWAEELARRGHTVRVLTAGRQAAVPRSIAVGGRSYEVQELATRYWPRSIWISRDADAALEEFRPELILWMAVGHHFGKEFARSEALANVPVVSAWSEHTGIHEFDWKKPGIPLSQRIWAVGFWILRGGVVRSACRRSTIIVGNTPHVRHILAMPFQGAEREAVIAKTVDVPLGFDPNAFSFDPALRAKVRAELGVGESEVLVCASSRFVADKLPFLTTIVGALRQVMARRGDVRADIVGFTNSPSSAKIRQMIAADPQAGRFIQEGFADRHRLNAIYNASDIVVFGRASISCQESLATGLVAVFSDEDALHQLVTDAEQAVFFQHDSRQDLERALLEAIGIVGKHSGAQREPFRRRLEGASRWLGYDRIIEKIMGLVEAGRRPGGAAGDKPGGP